MKSGFVAIVGLANSGKSTFLNAVLGEKVAIVSPKPQTTRESILGVLHEKDYQIAFYDTPGIFKAKTRLDDYMAKCVDLASNDVTVIVLMIDGSKPINDKELNLIKKFQQKKAPLIIALSKVDLIKKEMLLGTINRINELDDSDKIKAIVPISSHKKTNVDSLISEIVKNFTLEEVLYGEEILTDKSVKYMVKEIIREKVLYRYNAEIPHGVMVSMNKFSLNEARGIYEIDADVICEKASHKSIILGKGGLAIKHVSTTARLEMEKLLEKKVFLTLWVRVKEDWRNKQQFIDEM